MKMIRHYVTFYSPGTFFAEATTKEIDTWDVGAATEMTATITERYGAKPYGFQFTTRERDEEDFDSRQTDKSGMYYVNCTVSTLADIEERSDPADAILLANMRANGWDRVVSPKTGWRCAQPLMDCDVVIP